MDSAPLPSLERETPFCATSLFSILSARGAEAVSISSPEVTTLWTHPSTLTEMDDRKRMGRLMREMDK